jgi:NDP-sugar pyrophosphorylase family protein
MVIPVKPLPGLEGDYIFHEKQYVTKLSRFEESDIYCSGIQILNPARINELTTEGESFYSVWSELIEQRKLIVSSVYPNKWTAVDTLEQLNHLNSQSCNSSS